MVELGSSFMISLYFVFHFKIHQKIIYYLTETDRQWFNSIHQVRHSIIRRVWLRLEFVKSKFTINWIKRQSQADLCRHIQFNVAVHQLNFLQQFGLWFRDNLNFGQWSLMSCIFLKMDLINSNWLSAEVNCKSSHCASKNPERLIGWPIWQKVCVGRSQGTLDEQWTSIAAAGRKENPGCKSVGHQVLQCATKRLCLRIMGYVVSYFPGHRQSIGPDIQAGTNKQNQSIFLESWTSPIHWVQVGFWNIERPSIISGLAGRLDNSRHFFSVVDL